ncbi:MAG: hypothetical protein ABI687_12670 [Flavitalea sp.]
MPEVKERSALQPNRKMEAPTKDMTQRSLFNIVLKALGIYFIKDVLLALSQTVSIIAYLPQYDTPREGFHNLAMGAGPLLVYALSSWLLIFQTSRIIQALKLDRNNEEFITMRIHRSVILSLAVIVTGGITLVNDIPELFRHGIYYLQERKIYERMAHPDVSNFLMAAIRVITGFLLIMFNRTIVNFIEYRRRDKTPWNWPLKRPVLKRGKK